MTENNGTPDQAPGPAPEQTPYGQAPGQPPFGQQQYGQPQYGQQYPPPPPYLQPGHPQAQYQQQFTPYGVPDHPKATTALVLGLVGLLGGITCLLPVLVAPFAWAIGMKVRREIRQSNGQLGGDGSATAGMVLGIIGTVLLVLVVIGIVVLVIVAINDATAFDDSSTV